MAKAEKQPTYEQMLELQKTVNSFFDIADIESCCSHLKHSFMAILIATDENEPLTVNLSEAFIFYRRTEAFLKILHKHADPNKGPLLEEETEFLFP